MRKTWLGVALLALVFGGAACGGGGSDDDASDSPATTGAVATTAGETSATELPKFANDFERVCNTQVGFGGATSYEKVPGLHPMVFFEDYRGEGFIHSSQDFPAGWTVKEDSNFEDNSELKAAQLVGCSDQVKQTTTGKQCEFDDDGEKIKLELVNATYEVKVYEATTGKLVHSATIETKETECPTFVSFKKGDTKYVATPDEDEYVNAVKPAVNP